jgi:hypothetical protein
LNVPLINNSYSYMADNPGALTLGAGVSFTNAANATLQVEWGGTINGAGTLLNEAGATLLSVPGVYGDSAYIEVQFTNAGQIVGEAGTQLFLDGNGMTLASTSSISADTLYLAPATLTLEISGLTAGAGFPEITVTNNTTIGGQLNLAIASSFTPTLGEPFTIVQNEGSRSINGTFVGLPQGATLTDNQGNQYQVSYLGGADGDDVVLKTTYVATLPTATTLTSDHPAGSTYGQTVTFTATVATNPASTSTPRGSVQFQIDGSNYGSPVTLQAGAGGITAMLLAGSHTVTATYTSDSPGFGNSSASALSILVSPALLTVTANNVTKVYGQTNPTLTATITGFVNGDTASIVSGMPSLTTTATTTSLVGTYPITVAPGALSAANYTFAFINGTLTIAQDATTVVVTSPLNPSVYGQAVNLLATVTANAPGNGTASGTVTFLDGTTSLGTASLANGTASITTGAFTLTAASHTITVSYGGDANFLVSTSPALSQTVLSAQQENALIVNQVNNLVSAGILSGDNGTAMIVKLNSATASLNATPPNKMAAVNQLNAFINQVNTFQKTGKLTTAQAQSLTSAANLAIVAAQGNGSRLLNDTGISGTTGDSQPVTDAGQLVTGVIGVYLDNADGTPVPADEQARFDDAIAGLDATFGPYGVDLVDVGLGDAVDAIVRVEIADTSAAGSAADGVLGCTVAGQITLLTGWEWYTGADLSAIEAGQYDFQTIVTHELGHAVGLGHSGDTGSVMYAYLAPGEARRALTPQDLSVLDSGGGAPEPLTAAPWRVHAAATSLADGGAEATSLPAGQFRLAIPSGTPSVLSRDVGPGPVAAGAWVQISLALPETDRTAPDRVGTAPAQGSAGMLATSFVFPSTSRDDMTAGSICNGLDSFGGQNDSQEAWGVSFGYPTANWPRSWLRAGVCPAKPSARP